MSTAVAEAKRQFRVVTAERVPLSLPLAGIGERAIASSIDVIAIILLLVTLLFVYNIIRVGDLEQDFATATSTMAFVIGGLMLVGIVMYDVVADVFFAGRTPGKRLTGLRVIDAHGRSPDLLTSLLRNLLRLVDMLPAGYGVGVATMFFTGTRRLGDLVAGTVVVNERASGPGLVTEITDAAAGVVVGAGRLDDKDVLRLIEIVRRGAGLEPRLADRLCAPTLLVVTPRLDPSTIAAALTSPRRALAGAVIAAATAEQGLAARLWRLHDVEVAVRTALAAVDNHNHNHRRRRRDDVLAVVVDLDSAARAAACELLTATRRGVPARLLEPLSLALLEVERRRRPLSAPWRQRLVTFLADDVPLAVWSERTAIVRAAVVFVGAWVVGFAVSFIDVDVGRALIGDELMGLVEQGATWTDAIERDGRHLQATVSIGINNIGVGLRIFALGILGGVATVLGIVFNGVSLGATFGVAVRLDTADTLARFILAHGPVELSMICVAGAGGFCLGRAVLSPGQRSRLTALREEGRRGLLLLTFAVVGFAVIATVEGFVSPGRHFPLAVNLGVGMGAWLLFFAWARRGRI